MHVIRSWAIGTTIAVSIILAVGFAKRLPDLLVAWGNAWAESEHRAAAEDARRAEIEKIEAPQRKADEDYNESHCKVTVRKGDWGDTEVITNVRSIRPTLSSGTYEIGFGGGVKRDFEVRKTENCR